MRNRHQPVAVEGYPFIVSFAFLTLFFAALDWDVLTLACFGLTLFTVYFFRNPERFPPEDPRAVVAPADGKIIFIGKVAEERYFDGAELTKISIFMNVFNVHVNRAPVSGQILDLFYNRGRFFNASLDKASLENEQAGLLIETKTGQRVLCVQIAGLVARRIVCYPEVGDSLERGMRYGLIRFGSRVDVFLPPEVDIQVALGERTVAGETVLGCLE
ncbi:MAG: phosphatidylserine decarboxylase family protein [Deltaproteobacteria bacterium]|jgi:phosphatidylserine decarboxylase|nr:phosphatidylserine decarboxylase family protein [Deltaproteobacteria bacterium]MBW2520794.1 phosphatidylserine decarboxylase family protein [Deltaproteobacteria bacterium]